ncbi:SDR family NAD(P)-dependent oxidoreductase [Pelagovum pacificum]|uniref:SDR family oxidoreductase n=1 Tax=Pelagovum pacificum TaxID=2588711 RepID=A0A5C5GEL9_9RHOB|nr:SDR family oxidoreductase [Pelagovum pacificum]QQA43920.1 SDR family oxidoreductase [Pelagovum pacificum]TNY32950.1 SDR family oxidoreductase [Pelagovum pacificum]
MSTQTDPTKQGPLADRIVIVTGGAAGIGRGIVRQALVAGARVTVLDRDAAGAGNARDDGADFVQVDVTDAEAFAAAVADVARTKGRLDGMVNNAGITEVIPFLDLDVTAMDRLWQTNLRSVIVGTQAAARIMVPQGRGAIVNIASNHAHESDPGFETYAATKGGVLAIGRALAWSLGPSGVRVNTLSPGLTLTERAAHITEDPEKHRRLSDWHADGRINSPEDVGAAAVFLLSDASVTMNGSEMVADRGMSARLGSG